jgi:ribose transport system permease protein
VSEVKEVERLEKTEPKPSKRQSFPLAAAWPFVRRLAGSTTLYLAGALLVMVVVFSIGAPNAFLSAFNIRTLFTDASVLLILSVGQTFVITTAGIDLSVGSVLVFAGVVSDEVMIRMDPTSILTLLVGAVVALVAGVFWGLVNGLLVTKARIPALIATLGTLGMAFGIAEVVTNGNDITGTPMELVDTLGLGRLFGVVPWLVVISLIITIIGGVVLTQTRFGRYTLAIGSNAEAVRRAGIKVDRHLIKIYTLSGGLAGVAGFLSLARFATTTIAGHGTDNLQAISAVVLGGTSLFGGVASMVGTIIGVFIPVVLQNGLVIFNVPPFWQQALIGAILVVAVYVDQRRRRGRDRS